MCAIESDASGSRITRANTKWKYDGYRGWLTNKLDDVNQGPGYTYNAAGWLKTRTWARGTTTTYSYNPAGELSGVDYSDATPDVTYAYDRRGRQSIITQGSQSTSQLFNDAGQLLSQAANGLTVSNSYDLYLRRTNSGVWNGSAWLTRTEYTYDNASRLQTVGDGANSATYAYVPNSSLIDTVTFKQNAATRMTTTKSWDNLNRLRKIESVVGSTPVSAHSYAYNSANQRTSVTNAANARWVYQYDNLGQVTSGKKYWADGTPVAGQQFEYSFDDLGNRKATGSGGNEWGGNLHAASYTPNTLNQYIQRTVPSHVDVIGSAHSNATVTVNDTPTYRKQDYFRGEVQVTNGIGAIWISLTNLAVLNDGSNPDIITNSVGSAFISRTPEAFTYDLDGNQTSGGRWTNTWDAENKLISMESHSTAPVASKFKIDSQYNDRWRRTQKIVSSWNGIQYVAQTTNRFVYDGWNLVAVLNATNGLDQSFVWGTDVSGTVRGAGGVGGLISLRVHNGPNAGTYFYFYDANGNVAGLISASSGETVAEYEYDPFLTVIRASGPLAQINPFLGSTKFYDWESRLYYYGYRYYDASTGRWSSRDPLLESSSKNLYNFVSNDPNGYSDFLGLSEVEAPRRPAPPTTRPPNTPKIGIPGIGHILILIQIKQELDGLNEELEQRGIDLERDAPTEPQWRDQEIEALTSGRRNQMDSICAKIARRKPLQNQYIYAPTSLNRSLGAFAIIWGREVGQKAGDTLTPGWRAANAVTRGVADRSHLIAQRFGGDGQLRNLATAQTSFNVGRFAAFERQIDNLLNSSKECFVCVYVVPIYLRGKPVPSAFTFGIVGGTDDEVYESNQYRAPNLDGDLSYDPLPWNRLSKGGIEGLNY